MNGTRLRPVHPLVVRDTWRRREPHAGECGDGARGNNRLQPSRTPTMPTQFLNPPGLAPTNGWTQVVTSTGGRTVHVSGQVSVDERGHVVGKGDLTA